MSPEPILKTPLLSKTFGNYTAVDQLSFTVNKGEIFALLGPNGAGKTTTLRMLMGILGPTSGSAHIAGFNCFAQRERVMAHVGYVPDEPAFYEHLRGSEMLDFVATMNGIDTEVARSRVEPLAERLSLDNELSEFATNYSHGMKKKLAVLAALLCQPQLLILDEPTNGLDPLSPRNLHDIMLEERQRGTAILFSTHLLDQAQKLCDRVGILHASRLAAMGPLDELTGDGGDAGSLEDIFFRVIGSVSEVGEEPEL